MHILKANALFFFLVTAVYPVEFVNYTNKNYVQDIAIHEDTVWIGSDGGVVKRLVDGTLLAEYSTKDGLLDNNVGLVYIDRSGNKWFGTGDGVSKFDGTDWTAYTTSSTGISIGGVGSIAEDKQGTLWFGTSHDIYKMESGEMKKMNVTESAIMTICIDSVGTLWFGTFHSGVYSFDGTTWKQYYPTSNEIFVDCIMSSAVDKDSSVWFTGMYSGQTTDYLCRFDGADWTIFDSSVIPDNRLYSYDFAIDTEGNKWLLVAQDGVCKYDGNDWELYDTADGLLSNFVKVITIDKNNTKWFGYSKKGITRFNGNTWDHYSVKSVIEDNSISSICVDKKGRKWFGYTSNRSITEFDGITWNTDSLFNNSITRIRVDKNNHKWVASDNGLYEFNDTNWVRHPNNSRFKDVAIDREGNKWCFAWLSGALKFDGANWTKYDTLGGMPSIRISAVAVDSSNNKWFGIRDPSVSGVCKYDGANWTHYDETNALPTISSCQEIFTEINGNVWFGFLDYGAVKYDGTDWTSYTPGDGLVNKAVFAIEIDKRGDIWFGTDSGVSMFDGTTFTNYTKEDGLVDESVTAIAVDENNNKWIGTRSGLSLLVDTVGTWVNDKEKTANVIRPYITMHTSGRNLFIRYAKNTYTTADILSYDFSGRCINRLSVSNMRSEGVVPIDISNTASGNYICVIRKTKRDLFRKRFVIMK